jgi:hypothetical protein
MTVTLTEAMRPAVTLAVAAVLTEALTEAMSAAMSPALTATLTDALSASITVAIVAAVNAALTAAVTATLTATVKATVSVTLTATVTATVRTAVMLPVRTLTLSRGARPAQQTFWTGYWSASGNQANGESGDSPEEGTRPRSDATNASRMCGTVQSPFSPVFGKRGRAARRGLCCLAARSPVSRRLGRPGKPCGPDGAAGVGRRW